MVSREYRAYLKSPEWKEVRLRVIEAHDGKCQKCDGKGSHVHHITYRNLFNEPLEDLMLLCKECHEKTHKIVNKSYKNKYKKRRKKKKRSSRKKKNNSLPVKISSSPKFKVRKNENR